MIGVQLAISVALIGYRNHATRLLKLLEQHPACNVDYIYHPTKSFNDPRSTNDFSKLLKCDAILIVSPNHTHYEYLEKLLENFKGYIFCEKPPVTSLSEIEKLEIIDIEKKSRLFFNFNYRFSNINNNLKNQLKSDMIGKIIHINMIYTHGLAFKKEYLNSWRADGEKNLHNIAETVSIHYLDLLNLHFGNIKKLIYFPRLVSENGTSYDTDYFTLQYEDGITASILNSYASPSIDEITIVGTNGYFTIKNNELVIYSPRDTFNSEGFFVSPPIVHKYCFSMENDYQDSLEKSLDYFISHVKEKTSIDLVHFNASLRTNRMILNLTNQK